MRREPASAGQRHERRSKRSVENGNWRRQVERAQVALRFGLAVFRFGLSLAIALCGLGLWRRSLTGLLRAQVRSSRLPQFADAYVPGTVTL
jgi:hypothetical protein